MDPNSTTAAGHPFDLIPDPAVIHERIRAVVRTERILRKLLSVSLAARDEKASKTAAEAGQAVPHSR